VASPPAPSKAESSPRDPLVGVDRARLLADFRARFEGEPRLFSAPGRVNLIGEHTDYNGGFALPMAIDRRTYVAAAPRADREVVVRSRNLAADFRFHLDVPGAPRRGVWGDYIEGMARALMARGATLGGADLLLESEVPAGAGLSASAALELAVGDALIAISGAPPLDRKALALAGQFTENEYVGTQSGIMDQYVGALGRAGHALLIDCASLEARPVPLSLGEACFVVCDTRVKHALASSAYNQRRAECAAALRALNDAAPHVSSFRDITSAELERHTASMSPLLARRARHVVSENERVLLAARALESAELSRMGELMVASHRSLQRDFEVSCPELDAAVDAALDVDGVYGSRMTGGGFGGCTVTLLRESAFTAFQDHVGERVSALFQLTPHIFVVRPSAAAHEDALTR
jgi:galactokinase